MFLTEVRMSEDVFLTCLIHALSTLTEEIMGLLLGDIEHANNGSVTAIIWGASPQPRADRRRDQVATNPEQLAAATALADYRMTESVGRTTRVIGWYHSYPHITVHPSHVDVRTQVLYQLLDSGFIRLIFSCFNDKICIEYQKEDKVCTIQVIAFQSSNNQNQISKSLAESPINRNQDVFESSSSCFENALSKSNSLRMETAEEGSGDSRITLGKEGEEVFFADANTNYKRGDRDGEDHRFYNSETSNTIIDPMDTSEYARSPAQVKLGCELSSLIEETKALEMEALRGSETRSGSASITSGSARKSWIWSKRYLRSPESGSSRGIPTSVSKSRKGS